MELDDSEQEVRLGSPSQVIMNSAVNEFSAQEIAIILGTSPAEAIVEELEGVVPTDEAEDIAEEV